MLFLIISIAAITSSYHQTQSRVTTYTFPVWTERDSRRTVRARRQLHQEHIGVKPTSHDTKALWKMFLTRCHRHGDVGITRQIQASQSRVRLFTPTYLGSVKLHHHDSHLEGTQITYCPRGRTISHLIRNQVHGFVTAGPFNFNSESSHAVANALI